MLYPALPSLVLVFAFESCHTRHVYLDFQVLLSGDLKRRPLRDYPGFHGFGDHGGLAAVTALPGRGQVGLLLRVARHLQEVVDEQEPVEDEKHPEVVQDDGETGGVLGRSD